MPEIVIHQNFKRYHLIWELIHQDRVCKRFKVHPKESPGLFIVLENNEPLIRGKYQLKNRRIDWKQIQGDTMRPKTLEMIIAQIENPTQPEKTLNITFGRKKKKDPPSSPSLGERAGR